MCTLQLKVSVINPGPFPTWKRHIWIEKKRTRNRNCDGVKRLLCEDWRFEGALGLQAGRECLLGGTLASYATRTQGPAAGREAAWATRYPIDSAGSARRAGARVLVLKRDWILAVPISHSSPASHGQGYSDCTYKSFFPYKFGESWREWKNPWPPPAPHSRPPARDAPRDRSRWTRQKRPRRPDRPQPHPAQRPATKGREKRGQARRRPAESLTPHPSPPAAADLSPSTWWAAAGSGSGPPCSIAGCPEGRAPLPSRRRRAAAGRPSCPSPTGPGEAGEGAVRGGQLLRGGRGAVQAAFTRAREGPAAPPRALQRQELSGLSSPCPAQCPHRALSGRAEVLRGGRAWRGRAGAASGPWGVRGAAAAPPVGRLEVCRKWALLPCVCETPVYKTLI